jgi:hypothetical protein
LSERPDLATDQKAGALSGALLRKAIAIEKKGNTFLQRVNPANATIHWLLQNRSFVQSRGNETENSLETNGRTRRP